MSTDSNNPFPPLTEPPLSFSSPSSSPSIYGCPAIKGLIGRYESQAELILTGTPEALAEAKRLLTVVNTSLKAESQQLRNVRPKNTKHAMAIKARLEEIEPKIVNLMYCEQEGEADSTEVSLVVPPGYFFLCEKMLNKTHVNKIKPMLAYEGESYPARPYQIEAVKNIMKYTRSTFLGATGCGKSKVIAMLTNSYVAAGARVFIVTPSVYLMRQLFGSTLSSLKEAFPDRKVIISMNGDGEQVRAGADVVVSTTQSALSYIDRFDVVLIDELHTFGAETYMQVALAAINAQCVHGMTGSLQRLDNMQNTIPAWTGDIVHRYLYEDGIRDGYLNPLRYIQIPVNTELDDMTGVQPIISYKRHYTSAPMIDRIMSLIGKSTRSGRKVMVLGRSLDALKVLANKIGAPVADADYKYPIKMFLEGKIQVLFATSKLVGTGVDIPDLSVVLYLDNGVSNITLIQSAGRTTRKVAGKPESLVIDVFPATERGYDMAAKRANVAIDQGWSIGK
jgi:superfamily II DNA or RNA helicase